MQIRFRGANHDDYDFLTKLEEASFQKFQRNTRQNIKRGLKSSFQEIIIVENTQNDLKNRAIGACTLFKYKHMWRIYSIAILPRYRKIGVGHEIITHIKERAINHHIVGITLEVRVNNEKLVNWYLSEGFSIYQTLENYYCEGEDAFKMGLRIGTSNHEENRNIIVIDKPYTWENETIKAKIISVKSYINDPIYHNNNNFRVYNLCSSYRYQSYGYYISLLASARGQRIVPSVTTIRDFGISNVIQSLAFDLNDLINRSLKKEKGKTLSLDIFFGQTSTKTYKTIASKLFQVFEAPLFTVTFLKDDLWMIKSIKILTFKNLNTDQLALLNNAALHFFNKRRYISPKLAHYRYDIAMLINPYEEYPPSNKEALEKFKQAANKQGVYLEYITKHDKNKINEFDALFIRETTNVNHYTYELSRLAFAEGLVVIDDPWSILRCSNKIYQHELFKKHRIQTPHTIALTKNIFHEKVLDGLNYPVVFKQPDSAFSLGVIKVGSKKEAKEELTKLFKKTDMVICQEFLYSEFDWRIGILDNQALFACKYYMTQNHWQIYNWESEEKDKSGNHETVAVESVPHAVIKVALKAASLIGDGLYGVDLKYLNGEVYVIEVNDNPNIDFGVEDQVLENKLYEMIIASLINRIEVLKNTRQINLTNS